MKDFTQALVDLLKFDSQPNCQHCKNVLEIRKYNPDLSDDYELSLRMQEPRNIQHFILHLLSEMYEQGYNAAKSEIGEIQELNRMLEIKDVDKEG